MNTLIGTYKKISTLILNNKAIKVISYQLPIRIKFIGGGRIVAEIVDTCMN
jgi:hypothetical protein